MNLYIGNLPFKITEPELEALFGQVGQVVSVKIVRDNQSDRSRGFGFVEMTNDEDGKKAIEKINGTDVGGRSIVVNEARPKKERTGGDRPRGRY